MEESENILTEAKKILFAPFLTKIDYKRGRELLWYAYRLNNANAAFMISQAYRFGLWRFPKRVTSHIRFLGNAADRGHQVALAYLKYVNDDPDYRNTTCPLSGKYVKALYLDDRSQMACLLKDHYEDTGDIFALMELYSKSLGGTVVRDALVDANYKQALFSYLKTKSGGKSNIKYIAAWFEHIDAYEEPSEGLLYIDEVDLLVSYFKSKGQRRRAVKASLLRPGWVDKYFDLVFKIGPKRPSDSVFFIYWKAMVRRNFHLTYGDQKNKREHIEQAHISYKACITNAQKSTFAWLICAKRLGLCKDVAKLIAARIWRSRKEPDYWIWKEHKPKKKR
jgi:hypothetical protein